MMTYSLTEKKRIRKDFATRSSILEVPYLLSLQKESFKEFLQKDKKPLERDPIGLHSAFSSVFPIHGVAGTADLEYVWHRERYYRWKAHKNITQD